MRVVYSDQVEIPTVTFDGRQVVLTVNRSGPAVTPTKVPVVQIEQAMQLALERRRRELWAAAIRAVQQRARDDGDGWWLV